MRTLYNCQNAHVLGEIYCTAGIFSFVLPVDLLAEGEPLELEVCEYCRSYEETDLPLDLPPEDRGWLKKEE